MYHYTESGLDNVWLANGYTVIETPYGKGVSVRDADGSCRQSRSVLFIRQVGSRAESCASCGPCCVCRSKALAQWRGPPSNPLASGSALARFRAVQMRSFE
jgi:hypothetical protein